MSHHPVEGHGYVAPSASAAGLAKTTANWIGAGLSVALSIGIAVWGYRLAVRDVTEIPVIHAMSDPMRVLPDDPGGEQMDNQGLALNAVQSGHETPPPDQVVLAPPPVTLETTDLPGARIAGADEVSGQVDFVREAIMSLQDTSANSGAGLTRSIRPRHRPGATTALSESGGTVDMVATATVDVSPEQVAPGSRLVQLGAYDDRASAIAGWNRTIERHPDLLAGKKRLIQDAVSGGKRFYRLRAVGFTDLADTRRFCSVLLAADTPCIPVTAR